MTSSEWWPLIWSHLGAASVPAILFAQKVIVAIYSLIMFLVRLRHKKWIGLILLSLYIALRTSGRTPVVGKARKIHINQMITTTTFDPTIMKPTPVRTLWTDETFECIGWKRSRSCRKPSVSKDKNEESPPPEKDFLNCTEHIEKEMAGYCIVRNRTSGDLYKLMVSTCDSLANGYYTCSMARNFTDYAIHSVGYEHTPVAPTLALPSLVSTKRRPTNGILMIVYEKVLPSTYAVIRMLRLHQCTLPIEIWYRPDEMSIDNPIIHKLLLDFNVVIRPIFDSRATGFHVKPYAVYYSNFDNILLLDADNIPTKDPTYLFDEPEFIKAGALFWPDYWQPSNSLFQLTNTSLVWQMTGVNYVDQFEQESGQVLINRIKSKRALDKLMFYSTHQPRLLEELHLLWGDKDLFRFAWLNTSQSFHYIRFPPAVGGLDLKDKGIFCGLAMLQHDVQGNLIFFHRNSIKLDGTLNQPRIMSHIQEYALDGNPLDYRIFQAVYAHKECCYYIGTQQLQNGQPATQITPIEATTYASLEELAIQFSIEGRNLLLEEEKKKRYHHLPKDVSNKGKKKETFSWLIYCQHYLVTIWFSLRVQEVLALTVFGYVFTTILIVWWRARPARERLPSRRETLELKQN